MKGNFVLILLLLCSMIVYSSCVGSDDELQADTVDESASADTGNTVTLDVGQTCGGYLNEVCVSVTICEPGTSACQTIPRILVDTGSFGLRLFSSTVSLNLPARNPDGGSLAQCVSYLDGTSHWGPVKTADVVLAGERASNLPIQIIDSLFASVPEDCANPEASPQQAGYNGILGVGVLVEDCGPPCTRFEQNRIYFVCAAALCKPTTVELNHQVSNPVPFFETHNNGVILQLPNVSAAGVASTRGLLILGIGTSPNNTFSGLRTLAADARGNIRTHFDGVTYSNAFIDSGSNVLLFPATSSLPLCPPESGAGGFFCPPAPVFLAALVSGKGGIPQIPVTFEIRSARDIVASNGAILVSPNVGAALNSTFDWGLPFFFGKNVHVGIENRSSYLGIGPYWAF